MSELIGFVLVFSLIVSVVGIVSVAGMNTLSDVRDAERVNNAEQAMEVLADNMADIHERGAPSRATEISLDEAQLFIDDSIEVQVEGEIDEGLTTTSFTETFTVRPIVYDGPDDTQLVYVMGAIFRIQPDGEVVLREWSPVADGNYAALPVLNTTSTTDGSQSLQSQTVLVRANAKKRALVRANTTGDYSDLSIRVETPRNEVWERMLDDHPGFTGCTTGASPDDAECDLADDPRTFYLIETRMAVTIAQ